MWARADIYPDPARTPGAANPEITQDNIRETICNPRWSTKSIRPEAGYTNRLKVEQIGEYGYSDSRLRDYEEDHFIPLELGGNPTDPKNLWPEPFETSIPGWRRAHQGQSGKLSSRGSLLGQPDAGTGAARNHGRLVPRVYDVRPALMEDRLRRGGCHRGSPRQAFAEAKFSCTSSARPRLPPNRGLFRETPACAASGNARRGPRRSSRRLIEHKQAGLGVRFVQVVTDAARLGARGRTRAAIPAATVPAGRLWRVRARLPSMVRSCLLLEIWNVAGFTNLQIESGKRSRPARRRSIRRKRPRAPVRRPSASSAEMRATSGLLLFSERCARTT